MATGMKVVTWIAMLAGPADIPAPEYVRDRNPTIPILLAPAEAEKVEQLLLFVSTDGGRSWKREAVLPPDQKEVQFKAPRDGQFAFLLQVIDMQKRAEPPSVGDATPHLVLVIDTKPPLIRLRPGERSGGTITLSWHIVEDNLNASSVRLEYRTANNPEWQSVPMENPGAAGFKKFNVENNAAVSVRMMAQDLAGNSDSFQLEIPAAESGVSKTSFQPGSTVGSPPPLDPPAAPGPNLSPPAELTPPPAKPGTGLTPVEAPRLPVPAPTESGPKVIAKSEWTPVGAPKVPHGGPPSVAPGAGEPLPPQPKGNLPGLQYANNPRVDLEYRVGQVGPSGLKAVELWVTTDDGRTWKRHCDDPDLQSPIGADLAGEGVYGFLLLMRSGAGLARPDPQPGEPPAMRLEIDTTAPACTLYQVEADPRRTDFLHLLWNVTDRNLGSRPITLKWAEKPNGDWQVIASEIENRGRFAWQIPPGLPFKVYLRLEARDLAGNVGVATTPEPVLVDLTVPDGNLTGVSPGGKK